MSVVGERGAALVLGDALCRPQHSQSNGTISVPPLRCVVPLKCGDGTNSTRVYRDPLALSAQQQARLRQKERRPVAQRGRKQKESVAGQSARK